MQLKVLCPSARGGYSARSGVTDRLSSTVRVGSTNGIWRASSINSSRCFPLKPSVKSARKTGPENIWPQQTLSWGAPARDTMCFRAVLTSSAGAKWNERCYKKKKESGINISSGGHGEKNRFKCVPDWVNVRKNWLTANAFSLNTTFSTLKKKSTDTWKRAAKGRLRIAEKFIFYFYKTHSRRARTRTHTHAAR